MGGNAEEKRAVVSIVGFACNQGFVYSLFYLGSNRSLGIGSVVFERVELFGTLLFMLVAFLALRLVSALARNVLLARPLLWCYAALLVVGSFFPELPSSTHPVALVVECALLGLPAGFMLMAWGRVLGADPMTKSVPEAFIGSALGAAVCFACAVVPLPGAVVALNLLPLGSAAALRCLVAISQTEEEGRIAEAFCAPGRTVARLSAKIVAGTAAFGLASGCMETYGSDPGMATTPTVSVTLFFFVLFCLAALQMFSTGKANGQGERAGASPLGEEGPLDGAYRLAMLLMMAGFLFVPVLDGFGVPGEAIELAGYLGLSVVLVSLFLTMARIAGGDAALSFARGFSALYAGEMAGIALGNVIDVAVAGGQTPYAAVACAGLVVLFAYLFLFTERDFRALSVVVDDVDRFEEACARIARDAGLSKREAEILPLALRGRTGERIAAEFFISKSTVDTHLRRIYQKCGVHSRQELIDLGERAERDAARGRRNPDSFSAD